MAVNKKFHVDVEVDIARFAQELAAKNNEEQAIFFNVFFQALKERCGDQFHLECQCHSIREGETGSLPSIGLSPGAKDCCYTLSGMFNEKSDK
jgi:hypothetical protein